MSGPILGDQSNNTWSRGTSSRGTLNMFNAQIMKSSFPRDVLSQTEHNFHSNNVWLCIYIELNKLMIRSGPPLPKFYNHHCRNRTSWIYGWQSKLDCDSIEYLELRGLMHWYIINFDSSWIKIQQDPNRTSLKSKTAMCGDSRGQKNASRRHLGSCRFSTLVPTKATSLCCFERCILLNFNAFESNVALGLVTRHPSWSQILRCQAKDSFIRHGHVRRTVSLELKVKHSSQDPRVADDCAYVKRYLPAKNTFKPCVCEGCNE